MGSLQPQLLYLPGMDGTGRLFGQQAERLRSEFRVRCFQLNEELDPGQEESWDPLVEAAAAYMEPDTVICGESFGACLGLLLALRDPRLCRGLVLINPASSFRHGPWWLNGRYMLPWIPEWAFRGSSERGLGWLAELNQMSTASRQGLLAAVREVSPKRAAQRLSLLHQFDADRLPLEQLKMPVLIVAGRCDRLLPSVQEAERLAQRIPQAQVAVSPLSGHACLMEREMDLMALIKAHCPPLLGVAGVSRS